MALGEDERPPIIVRGGSLVIQSGDEKSSNPKHKKGRPWRKDGAHWKQKHDDGKDVKMYSVSFQGGGARCVPTLSTEVRVTYQLTSGEKVVVLIGRDEVDGADKFAGGKEPGTEREPLVVSARDLIIDNQKDQPTLTLALDGEIVSISAGGNVCSNPVSAKLQPVK